MKQCERCDTRFTAKVTYQIYCSEQCRDEATREKIAERYKITRRQKRKGKIRKCLGGCGQTLSIYNDDGFCSNCNISKKAVDKMLKQIKGYFDYEQN